MISAARRVALACAGALLALTAVSGCGDDTTDGDASSTASPSETASMESSAADVCSDLDTAKASLQALVETNVAQEGTNTLKERFATLQTDLRTLVESGQAELATQTEAVKQSMATLEDVLAGLKDSPTAADLAQLRPALQAVGTSTQDLITSLENTC